MKNKCTKEELAKIVSENTTWAEVCRKVGIKPYTGAQTHLKKKCVKLGIDSSHFIGQAWSKGRPSSKKKDSLELCKENTMVPSHRLKLKLIKDGYKKEECEKCGLKEWLGEPIVLELDHKNSDHLDNRFDNLQILCPNCHAQLTRNRKRPHVEM